MHRLCSVSCHVPALLLLWQLTVCHGQFQWTIMITKVYNCDVAGLKWLLENVSVQYHYPKTLIGVRYHVTEDIKKLIKFHLHIERCNDQGYDCEDFQNWKFNHLCSVLTWKNQIWSELVERFKPPLQCPIKKGYYEAQNVSLDVDGIMNWYPAVEKYRWKTTCRMLDDHNDLVYSATVEAHFHRVRRQNTKKPQSRKP